MKILIMMETFRYLGYNCEITSNILGGYCGYVYLKDRYRNIDYSKIDVPGGITFRSMGKIGFDCCYESYNNDVQELLFHMELSEDNEIKQWNITDIKIECEKIVDYLTQKEI